MAHFVERRRKGTGDKRRGDGRSTSATYPSGLCDVSMIFCGSDRRIAAKLAMGCGMYGIFNRDGSYLAQQ